MKFKRLQLENFKNYQEQLIDFEGRIIILTGKNGSGKTNLLDALHYLSFTKSALNTSDQQNILHQAPYFLIKALFEQQEKDYEVICFVKDGQKKVFKFQGKAYDKFSEHIGKILLVLHTPYDADLIRDASETRRKWADGTISQIDHSYLDRLLEYGQVLKQRNAYLKSLPHPGRVNHELLTTYDNQIITLSRKISHSRQAFLKDFEAYFKKTFSELVNDRETFSIDFKSNCLNADFFEKVQSAREKDLHLQRTTIGAHRDDFLFRINDHPIKRFGSQGQQKSFLIALRIAQYDYLRAGTGKTPILLLDDVFDKLDDERITQLSHLLSDQTRFGQVFLTDARTERTRNFFHGKKDVQFLTVEEGKIQADG
jgi:DNA replication and repair protein RecF